jgi:hypothetical protein
MKLSTTRYTKTSEYTADWHMLYLEPVRDSKGRFTKKYRLKTTSDFWCFVAVQAMILGVGFLMLAR